MPAGSKPGERRGGRQAGVPNRANIARQKTIAESGVTPLEVLIDGMRFHHGIALKAMKEKPNAEDAEANAKVIMGAMNNAREFAKDAAPYVHPKLAATEITGKDGGAIQVEDVSDEARAKALALFLAKQKPKP